MHWLDIIILIVLGIGAAMGFWSGLLWQVARVVRAEALSVSQRDFVMAARSLGASPWRLIGQHLLPNVLPLIVVALYLVWQEPARTERNVALLMFAVAATVGLAVAIASGGNILSFALAER